jgi:hypothetical protein
MAGAIDSLIAPLFLFRYIELQTSVSGVSEAVDRSSRIPDFTSLGTCRRLPVSTAIRINKPVVAQYKFNLKYLSHFLLDERAPRPLDVSIPKRHEITQGLQP